MSDRSAQIGWAVGEFAGALLQTAFYVSCTAAALKYIFGG